ncbi:MAG: efflux RND transporter periplasmic adaptor subunit [Bacteroidetes bacterium]|nr:efflux RND transporter periplasmic adaptor subunit [Bacteroidota bacterium]
MKKYFLPLFIFVLIIQSCSKSDNNIQTVASETERIPVRLQELKKSSFEFFVQTSGQFSTDDETMLAFKTGGIIEKILVSEGDAVRTGQVLAQLNMTEIEAQVEQAQLGFDKASRDFRRAENLYRDSVATFEQFQNAQTAMKVAERQLATAKFNQSYSQIRALSNGFILRKLANEGQMIAPGAPVLITNGASKGRWLLKVGVSDREWAAIQLGDAATITSDALPNRLFEAEVSRKSVGTDTFSGTFNIDLQVKNPSGLASGLFGNAVIRTKQNQSAWQIPYEALLDGNGNSGYVFISNDQKTAKKIPVVIGRIDKEYVTILSGLDSAPYLIISGSAYLKDGSSISVQ